jgi:hypothetical protein
MKTVVAAALALLAGLFLGGLRPRAELRQTQKELAEAKEAAARAGSAAALPMALGLGGLLAARDRTRTVPRFVTPDGGPPTAERDEGARTRRRRPLFADGGADGFTAAKTAADLRAAQFRSAFADEAGLSPDRQGTLDRTIDGMNAELARAADQITEELRKRPAGQKLRPREMADIGARLVDIYRHADDTFSASLDERGRAARERTEFDLITQVDLGAFRKLGETLAAEGVSSMGGR